MKGSPVSLKVYTPSSSVMTGSSLPDFHSPRDFPSPSTQEITAPVRSSPLEFIFLRVTLVSEVAASLIVSVSLSSDTEAEPPSFAGTASALVTAPFETVKVI